MKDIKQQLNVLMYDLTLKKMEDVKIGDLLMGDDGTYRRVISKTLFRTRYIQRRFGRR